MPGAFGPGNHNNGTSIVANKSAIETNLRRMEKVAQHASKRTQLKAIINDPETTREERFKAVLKLAELPRNSSPVRVRNRCEVTGRPRGYYRKMKMSRVALRELGNEGKVPGMVKSSW